MIKRKSERVCKWEREIKKDKKESERLTGSVSERER